MSGPDLEREIRQRFERIEFAHHIGLKIEKLGQGECVLSLEGRGELLNSFGTIQGGALVTAADIAVALALRMDLSYDADITTTNLSVNYLAPAKGRIEARARMVRTGRKLAVGEVDLVDSEGVLVARCIVTYMIARREEGGS